MRIDSSGNLGIGTSSPTFLNTTGSVSSKTIGLYNSGTATSQRAELQLGSAATASGNLTSGVLFGCGASDTTKNTLGSIFGIIDATSTTTASGALTFWTAATASGANTERMRIDSSGNVGIGTSSPDAKLSVNGVASFGDGTALVI
jgi:trimeric autotransporter adhesin